MAKAYLHPEPGESWTTPYYRMIRYSDDKIRASADGTLATNTTWANSAHLVAIDANTGLYHFDIPTGTTSGKWRVALYDRVGATAADTDTYLGSFDLCESIISTLRWLHQTPGQTESVNA